MDITNINCYYTIALYLKGLHFQKLCEGSCIYTVAHTANLTDYASLYKLACFLHLYNMRLYIQVTVILTVFVAFRNLMLSNSLCLSPSLSGGGLFWPSFCTGRSFTGSVFSFCSAFFSDTVCEVGIGTVEDVSDIE